jgi:transposase-like protein
VTANSYLAENKPPLHTRRKSEMVTALAEADTNEEFWPTIISRISDGEFISTIANELKVNHSILRNWIRGNKKREEEFMSADREGRQARINKVLQKVHETATADIEAPATRMEALRAAEIMLKSQGDLAEPKVPQVGIAITFVSAQNGKPTEKEIGPVS